LYKNNELIDTFIFNTNKIIIIKFNIPTTKYYLEEYNPKCHNIEIDMDYCFVIITNIINNIKINNFKSLNRACVNDGSYIGLFNKYNILQEYKFELPDIYFTCLIYSNYINIKKYNELIYTDIDDNSANISNIFNNIFISCDSLINELSISTTFTPVNIRFFASSHMDPSRFIKIAVELISRFYISIPINLCLS
jgi:hypothetical protein